MPDLVQLLSKTPHTIDAATLAEDQLIEVEVSFEEVLKTQAADDATDGAMVRNVSVSDVETEGEILKQGAPITAANDELESEVGKNLSAGQELTAPADKPKTEKAEAAQILTSKEGAARRVDDNRAIVETAATERLAQRRDSSRGSVISTADQPVEVLNLPPRSPRAVPAEAALAKAGMPATAPKADHSRAQEVIMRTPASPVAKQAVQIAGPKKLLGQKTEALPKEDVQPKDIPRASPESSRPITPPVVAPVAKGPQLATPPDMPLLNEKLAQQIKEVLQEEPLFSTSRTNGVSEVSHSARAAIPQSSHAQVEVARHVGGQLAVAISQQKAGVTEVTLSPQELGRVRMTMTAQDNAMVLSIVAERPETGDLMRRHIDQLQQEIKNLGYADVRFSFDDDTSADTQGDKRDDNANLFADGAAEDIVDAPVRAILHTSSALDLRM